MSGRRSSGFLCLVVCVLCCGSVVFSQEEGGDDHGFVESIQAAFNESGIDWNEVLTHPELETYGMNFDCPVLSTRSPAASVHELTSSDIKVVAAMGDSVTAGFGADAKSLFSATIEYRGVSWSIGGDKDLSSLITLPTTVTDIIKRYNPDLKGFSIKTGKETSSNARLNVAKSGAIAKDMPGQAVTLVEKIRSDSSIDFNNDWKLVTIWIGGNDLCAVCNGKAENTPENYVRYIKEAIMYLHDEMPRTFVNIVKILDVTEIVELGGFLDLCSLVHRFACNCARNAKTSTREAYVKYNELLEEMEQEFHDNADSDDFTVVLQPFMQGVKLPKKDPKSYFAPDCFHFSTKAHQVSAIALWNNMHEPLGMKNDDMDLESEEELKCPHEDSPYFFTHKNSRQTFGIESNDPASNDSGSSNILAILLGTGIALYVIGMVTLFTIIGVIWERKRRRRGRYYVTADSEKIVLVKK